jgi:16S rRNA (cytosine1402-N4)-methyltransferase
MMKGALSAPTSASVSAPLSEQSAPHITVLLQEAVDALALTSSGVYVDGTFGRGGHSRLILSGLGEKGRLIGMDRDVAAFAAGQAIQDTRFQIVHRHFSEIESVLGELGIQQVDGILLDLGISSPQIDEAERGFSFRFDGPLDMRMDQTKGKTAAEWLATVSEKQLGEVIKHYGEERFAKQVARAIIKEREDGHAITTTGQLAKVVAGAIPKIEPGQNPATRTFQALRIFINQELEELSLILPKCLGLLREGGRLVVISFHSLEDRIVKRFIQGEAVRDDLPSRFPIKAKDLPQPRLTAVGRAVKPSEEEVKRNPRARSAVMRVAQRTAVA